jgi:predicted SAM-dependent methyltransferase
MAIVDKHKLLEHVEGCSELTLELGCGARKRDPKAIGIDALDHEAVDIVGDVLDVLRQLPDDTVASVSSYHFVEHVEDIEGLMRELARVIRPGGKLLFVAPHFSNPYYYSDYTHQRPFGLYSFSYLAEDRLFSRRVHNYQQLNAFEIRAVKLIFKSPRPFYVRYGLKRIWQLLFNLNTYLMEFYEENLCYLFPCYEVRYQLVKKGGDSPA